jgi:hypothetical protein
LETDLKKRKKKEELKKIKKDRSLSAKKEVSHVCTYFTVLRTWDVLSRIRIQTFSDPDPNIFVIPDPGSYIKVECKLRYSTFSCFWWFQEQSLSLSHSQKDPGYEKNHPGFRSRIQWVKKPRIPDPEGKKASDPWSGSSTLHSSDSRAAICFCRSLLIGGLDTGMDQSILLALIRIRMLIWIRMLILVLKS